jgi:CheY-like chemotaxis protein
MSNAIARKLKTAVVLLVEDDPEDQALTRRAFQKGVFQADLRIVSDGQEAMAYLQRTGTYSTSQSAPRPDLVLLDLNMPNVDGPEVLRRVRANPDLQRIPIVVLTTSNHEADVRRSYDLGCNSFITKPLEMDAFIGILKQLESYWFKLVTLPSK